MGRKRALLSPEMRKEIDQALETIHQALADMDVCEASGQECSAYRQLAQYVHAELTKIKEYVYLGKRPAPEEIQAGREHAAVTSDTIPM